MDQSVEWAGQGTTLHESGEQRATGQDCQRAFHGHKGFISSAMEIRKTLSLFVLVICRNEKITETSSSDKNSGNNKMFSKAKQVRFVSAKAECPNHPSRGGG